MKIVSFSLAAFSLFFATSAHALTCEQWQAKLPPKYKTDFRAATDPASTPTTLALGCGKAVGEAAISYVKDRGKNAIIMQITAQLGIKSATTSLVMMTGAKVMMAYEAAKFVYTAFEKDAQCYSDHNFKRAMLEPVAHFYPASVLDNWVKNIGCSEISRQVYLKVQAVQRDVSERQYRQKQYDQYVHGRSGMEERAERLYPLAQRTLSPEQLEFLDKRERLGKPVALFDAATELLPCLKPESVSRMACGFVVELGQRYMNLASPKGVGLDPDLKESIERAGSERR